MEIEKYYKMYNSVRNRINNAYETQKMLKEKYYEELITTSFYTTENQKCEDRLKELYVEEGIIKNNITTKVMKIFKDEIYKVYINKYKGKNIGEKTREKINNECNEILLKHNIYARTYFYLSSYSFEDSEWNFRIYNEEGYKSDFYYLDIAEIKITIDSENNIRFPQDFTIIDEPKKVAKDYTKQYNKTLAEINKHIEKIKEIDKNYDENANTQNNLYEYLNIYVNTYNIIGR